MPLELSVWRIDSGLTRVDVSMLDLESRLEDILARDISIASAHWMVIGRQVSTPWGKFIDLLCIDGEGRLIVLELKRNKTELMVAKHRNGPTGDVPLLFMESQTKFVNVTRQSPVGGE